MFFKTFTSPVNFELKKMVLLTRSDKISCILHLTYMKKSLLYHCKVRLIIRI